MLALYLLMLLGTSHLSIGVSTLFSFAAGLVAFFFIVVCVLIFIFVYDNMRKQRKTVTAT
jgi:hypothetical protein